MPRQELYVGELMLKMLAGRTGEISRVEYTPQKADFYALPDDGEPLPQSSPEGQGVPSAFCEDLFRRLMTVPFGNLHRALVVRNGYVIARCNVGPFDRDLWHVTYSMCKSLTGMAIGMLVDEGKLSLDDKLVDYYEMPRTGLGRILKKESGKDEITIRHLLTMTSGVSFNESGAFSGNNWTTSYMESSLNFDPGERFEYNSMNSYMLSAIIGKITGDTLFNFLKTRLFAPMGIERVFWETSPEGITKGGWGLFMRIEDMAKLGQLYLQKGAWNGRQLVPADWVDESVKPRVETGLSTAGHYGYHLWLNGHREGSFTFNGMLGQNVYIYPDLNMVVVTQGGNEDIFQEGGMSTLIRDVMREAKGIQDDPLPDDPAAKIKLDTLVRHLGSGVTETPLISAGGWQRRRIAMTDGSADRRYFEGYRLPRNATEAIERSRTFSMNRFRRYVTESLNGSLYDVDFKSTGLIPLLMQVIHNNFTDGIRKIGFHKNEKGAFFMDVYEGDRCYTLECCFGNNPVVNYIDMHGENYAVGVLSRCFVTEERHLLFRSQVIFLEEAATRIIDIFFDRTLYPVERLSTMPTKAPTAIMIRLDETPGSKMLLETLKQMTGDASKGVPGRLVQTLDNMGAINMLDTRLRQTIQPTLHARRI